MYSIALLNIRFWCLQVSPTDDISRIVKSLSTRRYRLSFAHASNCASDVISQTSSRKETCAICLEDYSDRQVNLKLIEKQSQELCLLFCNLLLATSYHYHYCY